MLYEGARFHKPRYDQYGDRLGDLAELVRQGLQISVDRYDETLRYMTHVGRSSQSYSNARP